MSPWNSLEKQASLQLKGLIQIILRGKAARLTKVLRAAHWWTFSCPLSVCRRYLVREEKSNFADAYTAKVWALITYHMLQRKSYTTSIKIPATYKNFFQSWQHNHHSHAHLFPESPSNIFSSLWLICISQLYSTFQNAISQTTVPKFTTTKCFSMGAWFLWTC